MIKGFFVELIMGERRDCELGFGWTKFGKGNNRKRLKTFISHNGNARA